MKRALLIVLASALIIAWYVCVWLPTAHAAQRLSYPRAQAAMRAYWAPGPVAFDRCQRRGPGRIACWASGPGGPSDTFWSWHTVATLHHDGRLGVAGDGFVEVIIR